MNQIDRLHEQAVRRMEIAIQSVNEYKDAVDFALREAQAAAMSKRITVTEGAKLLGVDRSLPYKWGCKFKTYYQLWCWIRDNKPQKLNKLERNWKKQL